MHKLIEFLSNEMPDYADELILALNTAAESVGNIRDAITDMIPTLWKQRERRKKGYRARYKHYLKNAL